MRTCDLQKEPRRAGIRESPRQTALLPGRAGLPGPVEPLLLRLGWAERPSLPEENNKPVFLSSSCDPEGPHKKEEGGKGSVVPRCSLGKGAFYLPGAHPGLKTTPKNPII